MKDDSHPAGKGLTTTGVRSAPRGFTLIEILVVVAIMALLVAILLPSLKRARMQARRTVCLNNLHQVAVGLFTYQGDYKGRPPQWKPYSQERFADAVDLWVPPDKSINELLGYPTRLGMLYPKYLGRTENVFYCPDAAGNSLLNKDASGAAASQYPWSNYGKHLDGAWAYGSYEYRPRYFNTTTWVGVSFDQNRRNASIAADAFAGWWEIYGPYPVHSPMQESQRILYFNVAYIDGSAKAVKDPMVTAPGNPAKKEFGTRAAASKQNAIYNSPGSGGVSGLPGAYTNLFPANSPPPPTDAAGLDAYVKDTREIDRGWVFFDRKN